MKEVKLAAGTIAYILWPGIDPRNTVEHKMEFDRPLEVVEVVVCDRDDKQMTVSAVTGEKFLHYRLQIASVSDRFRLRDADTAPERLRVQIDLPFAWDGPIAETKDVVLDMARRELVPRAEGYRRMVERLEALQTAMDVKPCE
jgi:hypothetical protein